MLNSSDTRFERQVESAFFRRRHRGFDIGHRNVRAVSVDDNNVVL